MLALPDIDFQADPEAVRIVVMRKTDRCRLAEALAGVRPLDTDWRLSWAARDLLLLTAAPHMGRNFPYYCLWRLLEPEVLSTEEAFKDYPPTERRSHFIRRTKEEMVDYEERRLYPTWVSDTISYDLTTDEQRLYDETTSYIAAAPVCSTGRPSGWP